MEITEECHLTVNPFGKGILHIKFILVQGIDWCIWSMSVSVIRVVKILGTPELFTDQCGNQSFIA